MCRNCRTLPKNLWIRNSDELFKLLEPLNSDINDGAFDVIQQTYPLDDLITGKIQQPFEKSMSIIVQCSACGEVFTCAYRENKGAGFWNRDSIPF